MSEDMSEKNELVELEIAMPKEQADKLRKMQKKDLWGVILECKLKIYDQQKHIDKLKYEKEIVEEKLQQSESSIVQARAMITIQDIWRENWDQ